MKQDRLIGILTYLAERRRATAAQLSERFEVSRRTIHRDVETLSLAGIPIYAKAGGDGGIFLAEGYTLEAHPLLHGALQVDLGPYLRIDLASFYDESLRRKMALLRHCIQKRIPVQFDYYAPGGISKRVVEPHKLEYRWSDWYVYAYCREREDARLFKLARAWALEALEGEVFPHRELPPARRDAEIWQDTHRVRLRVERSQLCILVEQYGPDCYTEIDERWLEVERTFTHWDYMLRWILSFGGSARVLEPEEVRSAVEAQARAMLEGE